MCNDTFCHAVIATVLQVLVFWSFLFLDQLGISWGNYINFSHFYPTALKGCRGIVFTHGVRMGGRVAGKSLSGLYLRNRKV